MNGEGQDRIMSLLRKQTWIKSKYLSIKHIRVRVSLVTHRGFRTTWHKLITSLDCNFSDWVCFFFIHVMCCLLKKTKTKNDDYTNVWGGMSLRCQGKATLIMPFYFLSDWVSEGFVLFCFSVARPIYPLLEMLSKWNLLFC